MEIQIVWNNEIRKYLCEDQKYGEGAYGDVYKGRLNGQGEWKAIKICNEMLDEKRLVDANNEIAILLRLQSLDNPCIIRLEFFGKSPVGIPGKCCLCLVTPWIEGPDLRHFLQDKSVYEKAVLVEKIARVVYTIYTEKDIVHRDLKPENILVKNDGEPCVLDFGIAKVLSSENLTRTCRPTGTAGYQSPEQVNAKVVDHQTDIWALGIILYEAVEGERPFANEQIHFPFPLDSHFQSKEWDDGLKTIVTQALQEDKAKRYKTSLELADALAGWRRGQERQINEAIQHHIASNSQEQALEQLQKLLAMNPKMGSVDVAKILQQIFGDEPIVIAIPEGFDARNFTLFSSFHHPVIAPFYSFASSPSRVWWMYKKPPGERLEKYLQGRSNDTNERHRLEEKGLLALAESFILTISQTPCFPTISHIWMNGNPPKFAIVASPTWQSSKASALDVLKALLEKSANGYIPEHWEEAWEKAKDVQVFYQACKNATDDMEKTLALLQDTQRVWQSEPPETIAAHIVKVCEVCHTSKYEAVKEKAREAKAVWMTEEENSRVEVLYEKPDKNRIILSQWEEPKLETFLGEKHGKPKFWASLWKKEEEKKEEEKKDGVWVVLPRFRSLGPNAQGFLEYEDTLTGITFVCIPAGEFWKTKDIRRDFWGSEGCLLHISGNIWGKKEHLDEYMIAKTPVTCGQYQIFLDKATEKEKKEFMIDAYKLSGGNELQDKLIPITFIRNETMTTPWVIARFMQGPEWWNQDKHAPSGWTEYNEYHPVIGISWLEAYAFCKWAGYELPTEEQWEKAARGEDREQLYPWGKEEPDEEDSNGNTVWRCNFGEYSQNRSTKTTPVFRLENDRPVLDENGKPMPMFPQGIAPYGLLDISGNVWEWCLDWYGGDYGRSLWTANDFYDKVCCGGSWNSKREYVRVLNKGRHLPVGRNDDLGFRVVCARVFPDPEL